MANASKPVLRVRATFPLAERYRDLLRSDWTLDAAVEAVDLLRHMVAQAGFRLVF